MRLGTPTKNIYPLWSGIPAINAACQFWLIYCPVETLKKEDEGMLDECIRILQQGHVVAPEGHAGIVRTSKDSVKIKMLSSAQGTRTVGSPSQWRFKFFRLKCPEDLREEPPKVGGHQYQLFAPDELQKTH